VALRTQVAQFLGRQSGSRRLPPVLILGETGTGKGLLARAIHDEGPRAAGPFVAINCAAIPETLLEAELFGFEQGAFTDARHAKAGLFQVANHGTLFLDEIGLLPQSLQSKLLTALEDRTVRRLGSTRNEPIDVWIITATSEVVKPGARRPRIREDLFHRLAVVRFQLPPLRERGQDIVTLAEYFLAQACTDYGLALRVLAEDARDALLAYPWPGNVRELANLMERVALLTEVRVLTADTLELAGPRGQGTTLSHDADAAAGQEASTLESAIGEVERARILQALEETRGNITHAAARLGITRNTLRYRLQRYGLRAALPGTGEPITPAEPVGTTPESARPRADEGTSIAVLPLRNLSGDPGQDYFADGMTEALITELGKLSGLRLLSYQSVLGYRQTAKSLPQIARELNVEVVLEGSVLRAENRIRITANLVQAVPERHLWAESYEFDQRDVLAVQGAAARDVAAQIRVKVAPQGKERLVTSQRVDPEAHEAYLLGRAHLYKAGTPTSWMRAKEYFEKAIEKDPAYGPAYASLAELYIWTGGAGSLTSNPAVGASDSHRQARQWAEKALALDDTLADAHHALAMAKQAEWDWSAAERGYRRAIELNRSHAVARVSYAIHLYAMQRFEEAVDQAKRAQQLDPVSLFINTWAGAAYFLAGRTDEAMVLLRRTLELEPGYSDASIILARSYVTLGQYHEAIAELDKAMTFGSKGPFVLAAQAHAYARAGRQKEALKLVDELKQCKAKLGITPTFAFIWAYAGLDDKEQAFAWLETAYEERRQRMVWLNVDAFLDPLRSDPRFHDLVRRVGLPSA